MDDKEFANGLAEKIVRQNEEIERLKKEKDFWERKVKIWVETEKKERQAKEIEQPRKIFRVCGFHLATCPYYNYTCAACAYGAEQQLKE